LTREIARMLKTLARERDKAEILHRLRALRHDSGRRWGRMSAHQMVCHLSDGYRLLTGSRPIELSTRSRPRSLAKLTKWIALYLPIRWPSGIMTTPDLDQEMGGTRPVDFEADVAELARLLDHIASDRGGRFATRRHPIFGRMSESAWLRWAYLHADHHLRQFGV
jgi:hypothetical protein